MGVSPRCAFFSRSARKKGLLTVGRLPGSLDARSVASHFDALATYEHPPSTNVPPPKYQLGLTARAAPVPIPYAAPSPDITPTF